MNINIGDTVYIRCISQPPMDITTIVAKKEKEQFYKKGETLYRDVICCDIDENGKTERVRFKENGHMKNLYGDCLEGYNGKAYLPECCYSNDCNFPTMYIPSSDYLSRS